MNARGDDGTEPGSRNKDVTVGLATDRDDFGANVFAFPIAICPDHQSVRTTSLGLQVALDSLVVLWCTLSSSGLWETREVRARSTHRIDEPQDRGFEERERVAVGPSFVVGIEVRLGQMSQYRGDGDGDLLGRGRKAVGEVVVLGVSVGRGALQTDGQSFAGFFFPRPSRSLSGTGHLTGSR